MVSITNNSVPNIIIKDSHQQAIASLKENLAKAIVGKEKAIELVLVALFSGGHVLLEDVPGVGKTLLAKSLAKSIDGKLQRIQCTPDLLPTDITGTNIWNPNSREFEFLAGPVFSNILLADEINRATPRTQSALLEVMEEHQVTVDGVSRKVQEPFFVIATQNPIEYQGTFPLPEAQMDRFTIALSLGYPSPAEEFQMLQRLTQGKKATELNPAITLEEVQAIQQLTQQIDVESSIQEYMVGLVQSTRNHEDITLGVSPRGLIALQRASQALACLRQRTYVIPDDVKYIAPYVLAHRIIPSGGKKNWSVIEKLLRSQPVDQSQLYQ